MIRDTVPRALDTHPRSACYDDIRFISKDPELAAEAVEICAGCEFRACRQVARDLTVAERANREGTWDGALYINGRRHTEPKPISHGTPNGARAHRARSEKPCDPCRLAENATRLANRRARQEAAS